MSFHCTPLNLNTTPSLRTEARYCACGEMFTLECEFTDGICVDCQADAAGFTTPEAYPAPLLTRAQIDHLCGISHRRAAS